MRFRRTTEQVAKARQVFYVFPDAVEAVRKFRNCALLTHQFVNSCKERQYNG
jgi:hypothetical protein